MRPETKASSAAACGMSWIASSCLLLSACTFDSSTRQTIAPDDAAFADATPSDIADAGADAGTINDAMPDAQCAFDLAQLCEAPDPALVISGDETINTDSDPRCRAMAQGAGPEACLLLVESFTLDDGFTLRARGKRPLVIASTSSISISGTLDVASYQTGPGGAGHDSIDCVAGSAAEDDLGGAAGGAGGSFGGTGGDGGEGDTDDSLGDDGTATQGFATAATGQPAFVRGGCAGSDGGDEHSAGGTGGRGGRSGGAIHFIAIDALVISANGEIRATGAGGGGGEVQSGGGGGGSGGYIKLSAPLITNEGFLSANGGGGGEGGTRSNDIPFSGDDGDDGLVSETVAVGGSGLLNGGNGGNGAAGIFAADDGSDSGRGAGGGGGGAGIIVTDGVTSGAGESSPPWVAL